MNSGNETLVCIKMRVRNFNDLIQHTMQPLCHVRRLDMGKGNNRLYVVTVKKDGRAFVARIEQFYNLLKCNLACGERLETVRQSFVICGEGYKIVYCLEGYNKCADKIGYIEGEAAIARLIRRMPCEIAAKRSKKSDPTARHEIYSRMDMPDWMDRFPNPADRFVAIVRQFV